MRLHSTLLLFLVICITQSSYAVGNVSWMKKYDIHYPDDSLLNKITDIDGRLKLFTEKDTIGGYSTPQIVDMSKYLRSRLGGEDVLRDRKGLIIVPLEYQPFVSYTNFRDTIIFDPVMLPVVFDGKILPSNLDFSKEDIITKEIISLQLINADSIIFPNFHVQKKQDKGKFILIDKKDTFAPNLLKVGRIKNIRKQYYVSYPNLVKSNALAFDSSAIAKTEVEKKNPFKDLITAGDAIEISRPEVEAYKIRQVFWKFGGEHNLSVSQRAYSHSWNPKINDNFNIQSYQKFEAKYQKDKIKFNHLLEWRLNVQQVSLSKEEKGKNPDYNSLLIGDDVLRSFNTLGLQAFLKNWAYTITLEAKMPMLYKKTQADKNIKVQGPFSPLDVNFGIGGIEYSLKKESKSVKGRKIELSANLAPFSFTMRHVGSRQVYDVVTNNFGVYYEKGHKKEGEPRYTKTSFGSTVNANIQYHFNSYTFIRSRLKYDTDYDSSKLESETTIEFKLNRYFSTNLYVYMKYDDSDLTKRDAKWKYFSVNEVLGFGLSYSWN